MIFVVNISPTWWDNACWVGNTITSQTFNISTTRSKKVPPTLYEFVNVKMRAHIALKQIPFGDYTLSNYYWKVLSGRPLNWNRKCFAVIQSSIGAFFGYKKKIQCSSLYVAKMCFLREWEEFYNSPLNFVQMQSLSGSNICSSTELVPMASVTEKNSLNLSA